MSTTTLLIRKELMYLFRNLKFTWVTTLILVLVFAVVYPGANLVACIIGPYMLVYGVMAHELDIDRDGYRPKKGEKDIHGKPLEDRVYLMPEFDRKLIMER